MATAEDFASTTDFALAASPASSHATGQQHASRTTAFLVAGLVGEALVPWSVIWLSDVFAFDIPAWSQ